MLPTNIYYISLEWSFYNTYALFCCIKMNAEMAEKSQVKDCGLISTSAPVSEILFHILPLNMD